MTKPQNEFEERIIEQLAELEHQQWVEWAITIMKQEPISKKYMRQEKRRDAER